LLGQFDLSGIPPAPRGVPKITVDLDIDANGILNVSAKEESSGKTNKVTITNDKNRLSQSDIEKMVKEAEKFKEQDELLKSKVEARNSMENYVYQIKNAMTGEMKDKFSEEDKTVLNSLVNDTLQWIESGDHSKEDYDVKQKEIESVYFPIIQKAYGGAGGAGGASGGMPPGFDPSMFTGGMPKDDQNASNSGSNIEELD
jgi:L1 cell adhesion molecule like protein